MSDSCECGCCEGPDTLAPLRDNTPGESTVDYRARTHASFKASMLARLSSTEHPALEALRTRQDDDFAVALCDAAATLLDVLTFYQERYANEFFLRTATERRSIVELARLIGYRPSPGVAANTYLAFMLEEAPGAPALAAEPVTIAAGTRVQSVPGPGEDPQTFETAEDVLARVEWNAIPVQTTERQTFAIGTTDLFVSGVTVPLQSGDVVLIVGDERLNDPDNDNWDARAIDTVERDNDHGITQVTLSSRLGDESPVRNPASVNPRAYVFRQRAAVFGHNAPDPNLLFNQVAPPSTLVSGAAGSYEWIGFDDFGTQHIDLDNSYPKIVVGSWLLLTGGEGGQGLDELPGLIELALVTRVRHRSRSAYGLSGRITRVNPDATDNLVFFSFRETGVFVQSEELPLAERRLTYPLYGTGIALGKVSADLERGQPVAVAGRLQRLQIVVDNSSLQFLPDGADPTVVKPGDSFIIGGAPSELVGSTEVALAPSELAEALSAGTATIRWRLTDRDGQTGTLDAPASAVALVSALKDDPMVRELCVIADSDVGVTHDRDRTTLQLDAPLVNVYDRFATTVCANLAPATNGESVSEIAGSGDATVSGQRFMLKQSPLTYVSAATPDGGESTLDVQVDGLSWDEVPTLFEQSANAHVYALRQDGDGRTIVQFGDGVEGARLPSGQDNIRLSYRKFLGAAGNLDAGRLTTLLGRPLGVKSVSNVTSASGGEDAEALDDARRNAPLTMLTLGRAVSIQDYTDFSRSFAGIAKAQATWVDTGAGRLIFVSVAGPGGAAVDDDSDTMANLRTALRDHGDALVPLTVHSYSPVAFKIEASIKVADAAKEDDVLAAVEEALRSAYAFDSRDFGQTVSIDEVMAIIHAVRGVDGADVDALYRADESGTPLEARLFAYPARLQDDGTVTPAELLTLDAGPLQLGVMS